MSNGENGHTDDFRGQPRIVDEPFVKRDVIAVVLLMVFGACCFFYRIGHAGFWHDEAASWMIARDWREMWVTLRHYEANMWLYYVVLHGWMKLFGDTETAMRSLSALAATACIPFVYETSRCLFSRRAAWVAALLLIFHVITMRYAQEARSYAWLELTSAISSYLMVRMIFGKRYHLWPVYGCVTAAGVWFHFHGIFVPMAHYLFIVGFKYYRLAWKPFLAAGLLLFVLVLPIPIVQPVFSSSQVNHLRVPGFQSVAEFAELLACGAFSLLMVIGLWLLVAINQWRKTSHQKRSFVGLAFVTTAIVSPLVAVYFFSRNVMPLWHVPYLIFVVPLWCVWVSGLMDRVAASKWMFGVVSIMMLVSVSFFSLRTPLTRPYTPLNDVVRHIQVNAVPGDGVVIERHWRNRAYFYAASQADPMPPLAVSKNNTKIDFAWINTVSDKQVTKLPSRYPRLWVIIARRNSPEEWAVINAALKRLSANYRQTELKNVGLIRVFMFEANMDTGTP